MSQKASLAFLMDISLVQLLPNLNNHVVLLLLLGNEDDDMLNAFRYNQLHLCVWGLLPKLDLFYVLLSCIPYQWLIGNKEPPFFAFFSVLQLSIWIVKQSYEYIYFAWNNLKLAKACTPNTMAKMNFVFLPGIFFLSGNSFVLLLWIYSVNWDVLIYYFVERTVLFILSVHWKVQFPFISQKLHF